MPSRPAHDVDCINLGHNQEQSSACCLDSWIQVRPFRLMMRSKRELHQDWRTDFHITPQSEPLREGRDKLPEPEDGLGNQRNLWSIIKDVVHSGDFARMPMPVSFHEPLSELQQRAEDLEYSELLDEVRSAPFLLSVHIPFETLLLLDICVVTWPRNVFLCLLHSLEIYFKQAARMEPHSLERMLNVAAFSLSAYSGVRRTCKPFNSLMGETYELACPAKGFRFLAEKVTASHKSSSSMVTLFCAVHPFMKPASWHETAFQVFPCKSEGVARYIA